MKCENIFCVYQKDGQCRLGEITLDIQGRCEDCVYVEPDEELLEEAKARVLESWGENQV